MKRKIVAGMLTFAMVGMLFSGFQLPQACAVDSFGNVEVHVSAKEGSLSGQMQLKAIIMSKCIRTKKGRHF